MRSFGGRVQYRIVRALMHLPPRVQYALSGSPPIQRDGLTLHPEIQLLLSLRRLIGAKGMSELEPPLGRISLKREAITVAGRPPPVRAARDLEVTSSSLRARHYAPPAGSAPAPLLVYYHGGGFVLGDLETHDALCRFLCREVGVHVLSIEYRLAPEAPFPAAVDDARAAFLWAVENAAGLGADPSRVAVGGDSAGGNLATVVSQRCTQEGGPLPAAQLLLYPAVDCSVFRPSADLFAEGFFITRSDITWFMGHYLAGMDPRDPRVSPALCTRLSGQPPALVVTAGFDPLRDEGDAYALALQAAGTRVIHRRFDPLIHAFASLAGISPACAEATRQICADLRALLQGSP